MAKLKVKIGLGKISFIMIAVFAALLTCDLVLKGCEEAYGWNFTVIPNFIWVESGNRNFGAAFSFLAGTGWGGVFFIVITIIMSLAIIAAFIFVPDKFVLLKLAMAMILSGAIGNLVDRIAFGNVRDFVWVNMLGHPACCNFADFWIVFGVILAALDMLFFNEWAVIPLTKKAKAAAKQREEDERLKEEADENGGTEEK